MSIKKVLLTGGRAPGTLELARLCDASGFIVHVAESLPQYVSKGSRSVTEHHLVSKPKQNTDSYILELITIVEREHIDILIPTCEETFYISRYKDSFPASCLVYTERWDVMQRLHNKYDFIYWAKELGLSVPHTELLTSEEAWRKKLTNLHRTKRFVAKPVFSRFSSDIRFIPETKQSNIDINENRPWVWQDYIEGELFCTYSIAREGRLLAHSTYRSDYRAGIGASIAFKHREDHDIEAWVKIFVERIGYSGQIGFDFIRDKDGQLFAIECNPRLTSGIHLFRDTEFISALLQNKQVLVKPQQDAAMMVTLAMLLYAPSNMKRNGLRSYIRTIFHSKDVLWRTGDSYPLVSQFSSLISLWKISRRYKCSLLEATTYDIAWDGEGI